MKGYGVSFGAISVLNAIPCGIGSTVGIKLRTEAFYEESDDTEITLDRDVSDGLARTCVERTLRKIGKEVKGYRLTIKSDIPPSVGLKSSSSVCNSVISAVVNAYGEKWKDIDIVKLGVECAKDCGVTVTGAFDDACGCMFGGLVITNNAENRIILRKRIPKYDVVLCIPEGRITKDKVDVRQYRKYSDEFLSLANSIEDDFLGVLTKNGKIVGRIAGYKDISDETIGMGALASGITGTGPATAIVVEHGKGRSFAEKLDCNTIVTETRSCISFSKGKIDGIVTAPPSKSHTHRAMFMATLSKKDCTIRNRLQSDDVDSTVKAIGFFGSDVRMKNGTTFVKTRSLHPTGDMLDVGNSGTTMRFAAAVSSLFDSTVTIDGDDSIRQRTNRGLIDALERCGTTCSSDDGKPPLRIKGPIKGNVIEVDGSDSSQFVSSMLIIAPNMDVPVDVVVKGKHVSEPYIDMTVDMMRKFGIDIVKNGNAYHIDPGRYDGFDYTVPGDFSSAAYLLVAGGISGKVTVEGLDMDDVQGDRKIVEILKRTGCSVTVGNGITCINKGTIKATDVDLSDVPDLFPAVAVLLSTADGTSRLYGAPHLRNKETDRITATVKMLSSMGADISETDDGCIINGVRALRGGTIEHYGDHRIMMAAALASLVSANDVTMDEDGCWKVSYPDFVRDFRSIGVR